MSRVATRLESACIKYEAERCPEVTFCTIDIVCVVSLETPLLDMSYIKK